MIIRTITGTDIPRIPEMWREDQPFVPVTVNNFIDKIIFEENFTPDSFFIADDDNSIAGFLYCTYRKMPIIGEGSMEKGKAYILGFCVADRSETQSVGGALIDAAEAYMRSKGRERVDTGYFPVYYVQGFERDLCSEYIALFKERGYRVSEESCSLELFLADYQPDPKVDELKEKLAEQGIVIRSSRPEDSIAIADAKMPFSKESWAYEYKTRLRLQHDCERVKVAVKDGALIGVSPFGDPNSDMGRFGPFGVDPAYRGLGIGKVLFQETMKEMKKRGIARAWMQWVEYGGPGFHIYEKCGFRAKNNFISFEKEL